MTCSRCFTEYPVTEFFVSFRGVRSAVHMGCAEEVDFPVGYIPRTLPKKDQVKLAGNAVTPPVMAWIVGRVAQALEAA